MRDRSVAARRGVGPADAAAALALPLVAGQHWGTPEWSGRALLMPCARCPRIARLAAPAPGCASRHERRAGQSARRLITCAAREPPSSLNASTAGPSTATSPQAGEHVPDALLPHRPRAAVHLSNVVTRRSWTYPRVRSRAMLCAVLALSAALLLLLWGSAMAAAPRPGGIYSGATFKHYPVRIVINKRSVRKGVYRGSFTYCGLTVGITVVRGQFGFRETTAGGAVSVFRGHGFFSSATRATGRIDLDFTSRCDGLPGAWTATLKSG